jgi:hypothetical protein
LIPIPVSFFLDLLVVQLSPLMAAVPATIGIRELHDVDGYLEVFLDRLRDDPVLPSEATKGRDRVGMLLNIRFMLGLDRFLADEPDLEPPSASRAMTKQRLYL